MCVSVGGGQGLLDLYTFDVAVLNSSAYDDISIFSPQITDPILVPNSCSQTLGIL